jgi:TatD DNase family protein
VVNGTHPDDWPRVAALAAAHPFVFPAYGIHPWDTGAPRPADWLAQLRAQLLAHPQASVGEIGLDRWMLDHAAPDDPRLRGVVRAPMAAQIEAFLPQLALAAELDRAASIHCVQAYPELLPLLRQHRRPARGFLLHAYSGPAELVPELVALGAYFSFNPAFLEPRKSRQAATFKLIPPERLLAETDAPAMPPPQAWRTHKLLPAADGSTLNHPGNIEAAYTGLAALRGEDPAALAAQLAANFTRLFGTR